jgi:hypothetical protein
VIGFGYSIGRWLLGIGLIITVLGAVIMLLERLGLGRLPGDFQFTKGRTTLYFPIATSIILSIVLTVILNLIARWRR